MRIHTFTTFLGALALGGLLACGGGGGTSAPAGSSGGNGGGGGTPTVSVVVNPATASVPAGGTQQFAATVTGNANTAVTWSTDAGTVSAAGLFTAPASATVAHVKATSQADTNASATATVTVTAAEAVTISPSNPSLSAGSKLQFTAITTSGGEVTWKADGGSITNAGLFTAPATAGSVTITATSAKDNTKSGSTKATVTAATGTVVPEPQLPKLEWKERPGWVNVKTSSLLSVKAVGDGTTDDTKALQAALDLIEFQNGGQKAKVVFLPPGTYKITSELALGDCDSAMIVGCGRDTIIRWGGKTADPDNGYWPTMFRSIYGRQMEYVGFVLDGAGAAFHGTAHCGSNAVKGAKQFEAKNVYRFVNFKNFQGAGSIPGVGDNGPASSEQEYRDCLFQSCGFGLYVCGSNYYNYVVANCDFYDCGIAVNMTYFANGYVRRCHFERSRVADVVNSDPCFAFSVRHCTSIGSRRFYEPGKPTSKYQIQDCVVEGWSNMSGAAVEWDPNAQSLFDMKFINPPSSFPPVYFTRDSDNKTYRRKILSNVTSPGTSAIYKTDSGVLTPLTVNRTAPASQLTRADQSWRTTTLDVSGKVFDVKAQIALDVNPSNANPDHTKSIQKCIDAAKAEGKGAVVYFQQGTYNLEDTVIVDGGNYSIEGTGFDSRMDRNGSKKTPLIEVRSPQNVTLRRFSVPFTSEGLTGIRQIRSSGVTSSMVTYDQVTTKDGDPIFGNPSYRHTKDGVTTVVNFEGLLLDGLSTGDKVDLKRVNGTLHIKNCGNATILGEFVDCTPMIIEGTETTRNGFIGVLNANSASLQVRDNQNFVIGDYYTEQSGGWGLPADKYNAISLTGNGSTVKGSAVIGMAKYHAHDTDNLLTVDDYEGFAAVAFPFYNTGDRPTGKDGTPFTLTHKGTKAVDLLLLGHNPDNYNFIESGSGAALFKFPDADSGSTQAAKVFDRLAELGAVDLSFNPSVTLGYVQTPTMQPAGGSFHQPVNVLLRTATDGAKIRYTTDGTDPSGSGAKEVANNTLLKVDASMNLRLYATKSGLSDSPSVSSTFSVAKDGTLQTVWADSKVAKGSLKSGGGDYGQTFSPTVDGWITAVRAYALAGESGEHLVRIWSFKGFEDTAGTLLAGPYTFTYGGTAGWVKLDIPALKIEKDKLYVVSISAGTDKDGLVPTIEGDADITAPSSNGLNLIRTKFSAGYGSLASIPTTPGAVKNNFLRDVVFVPDAAAAVNPPSSVPATPAAPTVANDNSSAPKFSGTAPAGTTVHLLFRSTLNGNDGVEPPVSVKVGADGTWTYTATSLPKAAGNACVMVENDKGLSLAGPTVNFTVK